MKGGDERENMIHLESSRNGFIAYAMVTMSLWAYSITHTDEVSLILYLVAYGPFFVFVISMIYYHWRGLKNSLSLSSLRSD